MYSPKLRLQGLDKKTYFSWVVMRRHERDSKRRIVIILDIDRIDIDIEISKGTHHDSDIT